MAKSNIIENINRLYNTLTPNFFAPYIMQPTRFGSQLDKLKILISDHRLHILDSIFKEVLPKKIYERNI